MAQALRYAVEQVGSTGDEQVGTGRQAKREQGQREHIVGEIQLFAQVEDVPDKEHKGDEVSPEVDGLVGEVERTLHAGEHAAATGSVTRGDERLAEITGDVIRFE